eukprot:s2302_g9.t1
MCLPCADRDLNLPFLFDVLRRALYPRWLPHPLAGSVPRVGEPAADEAAPSKHLCRHDHPQWRALLSAGSENFRRSGPLDEGAVIHDAGVGSRLCADLLNRRCAELHYWLLSEFRGKARGRELAAGFLSPHRLARDGGRVWLHVRHARRGGRGGLPHAGGLDARGALLLPHGDHIGSCVGIRQRVLPTEGRLCRLPGACTDGVRRRHIAMPDPHAALCDGR